MNNYITTKEYAKLKGISERTVQRQIARGEHQVKEIPHPTISGRMSWLISCDTEIACDTKNPCDTKTPCDTCDTKTPYDTCDMESPCDTKTVESADTEISCDTVPSIPDSKLAEEYIPYHKMDEAQLYALLMESIESRLSNCDSRVDEWAAITDDYNQRRLVPELRIMKGRRSERGLRNWHQKWRESDQDMFELVHKNNAQLRGRIVTHVEQNFLRASLLCGWEKPIMNAIRDLKLKAKQGALESPSSISTLKRWIDDFATSEPAIWTQGRKSDKKVMEEIVKSVQRDDSVIEPLQVVVVDGHKLNVFVKHPITGKPFRPTLIMVFDWGTRYPVGMSLALTEDSAHTLTAFRNAFLQMGQIPRWALLDNGKAFRSKLFNAKWEDHDLEREFAGIFPRLGIDAHFAKPYNAKSKVVERFFRTLTDQWATRQKSYCGRDIKGKPAHFQRNEKWMQEMYGADAMEYSECMQSIYKWIRFEYGMEEHSSTGQRPYEHFANAPRDPDRLVDPVQLNILMLTASRKKLRSEGITLFKNRYWAPELVDHMGNSVVIRYDYNDLRSILVYDERSRFICQAPLRESQSAWIYAEMDNPLAAQKLWAETREIENLKRSIKQKTKKLVNTSKRNIEAEIKRHQDKIEGMNSSVLEANPAFINPPMMPPMIKKPTVNDDIAMLERKAMEANKIDEHEELIPDEVAVTEHETVCKKVIRLEDILTDDEGDLAETVSFAEMQKIIGLK